MSLQIDPAAQAKINQELAKSEVYKMGTTGESKTAYDLFEQGLDFNSVKAYIQGNVRADAPGFNLTSDAYNAYQTKQRIIQNLTAKPEISPKDTTPNTITTATNIKTSSLLLPVAVAIGVILIAIGMRGKK